MSDKDPDDIDVDDLVTQDELDALRDALEGGDGDETPEEGEQTLPWDDPQEAPFATTEDVTDAADQTFMQRLQHLANDECDTPECESLRDAFGLGGDSDTSGAGSSEGGADADAEGNDESDGGGSDSSTDGDTSGESSDPESDGDGDGGDGEPDGDDTYTPPWEQ